MSHNNLTFNLVEPNELDILRKLSIDTYKYAFANLCSEENMNEYLSSAFSKKTLRNEFENPESAFYFMRWEGEVCGYFKINWGQAQKEFQEEEGMELERIYVSHEFQGKNIGGQTLEYIKQLSIEKGKKYLWLGVWEKNEGAFRLYERNGFVKVGAHSFFMGDDEQTDYLMKLQLV